MAKRGRNAKGSGGLIALIKSVVWATVRKSDSGGSGRSGGGGVPGSVPKIHAPELPSNPPNMPPMQGGPAAGVPQVFIPQQRNKPYSGLTRNLGVSILRLGSSVPPDIQQAASDAANGTGNYKSEKQLQNFLRQAMGIEKTGATELNRTLHNFNRGVRDISTAATLMDVSSRGGAAGAAAKMGLVQMAMSKGIDFAQSKVMKSLLTQTLGGFTGGRAFYALSAGARMGGAVMTAAYIGGQAGLTAYDNSTYFAGGNARLAQAKSSGFDTYKKTGMDPRLTKEIGEEARAIESPGGFYTDVGKAEAIAKRRDKIVDSIVGMRAEAQALGIDVAGIVGRWASARGINPDQVTPENRAMLVDLEIKKKRDALMRHSPESAAFIKNKIKNMSAYDQLDYKAAPASEQRIRNNAILSDRAEEIFKTAREAREVSEAAYVRFISAWQTANDRKNMGGRLGSVTFSEMQIKLREFDMEKSANSRRHQVTFDD